MTSAYFKKWKQYQNYIIIGITSCISLFFLPMIGSSTEAGFDWPTNFSGWCIYIFTKIVVACINIVIFHSFVLQGEENVKDNPYYIEAKYILMIIDNETNYTPIGPDEWRYKTYRNKGITIFITSVLSVFTLTNAILTFDWLTMLSYFVTLIMGIIFGIFQMNKTEEYFTTEFWQYAIMMKKRFPEKFKNEIKEDLEDGVNRKQQDLPQS